MSIASAQQGLSLISQNNATLSTYSDQDIGFNFSYPSDWTLYTNKTRLYTVASFESPDKVATVDIRIFPQATLGLRSLEIILYYNITETVPHC